MKSIYTMLAVSLALASPVEAQKVKDISEPSEKPDWGSTRKKAEENMRAELIDPQSAQFTWTSGFEWGYVKPLIGKRGWGWVACVDLNAKNRLGGYVGTDRRWVIYSPPGKFGWGSVTEVTSQCDTAGKVPLQPELAPSDGADHSSVSDKLMDLSKLLEKGLLTRSEYETAKQRLIGKIP